MWAETTSHIPHGMVFVGGGEFRSFTAPKSEPKIPIKGFYIDSKLVSNQDFANFLKLNPSWTKANIKGIYADERYLASWEEAPPKDLMDFPVTSVSWFAAKAYCKFQGKRLPTVGEWEISAQAPDSRFPNEGRDALSKRILNWYSTSSNTPRRVGSVYKNIYGIYDMHGSVWEWTLDFNSATLSTDNRSMGKDENFCGASAGDANDRENYAAYMRYAMRSSLKARSTTANLGFRCAKDIQ